MSAARHINRDQLAMFMTPSQIKNGIHESVDGESPGASNEWYSKQDETLKRSISREGVRTPVILDHESTWHGGDHVVMGNGHHRVENAHRVEKEEGREIYVPVIHTRGDYMGMGDDMYNHYPKVAQADGAW